MTRILGQLTQLLTYAFRRQARRTTSETCYLAVPHHENYKRLPAFWSRSKPENEELVSTDKRGQNYEVLTLSGLLDRIRFLIDSDPKNAGVFALKPPRGVSRPPLGQGAVRGTVMARVSVLNLVLNTSKTRV